MNASIFLIESQEPNNTRVGTGFVIHQDRYGSFVLTCAHVIEQIHQPMIDGVSVEIREMGSSETIDLALLYIKGVFKLPFPLQRVDCPSESVELIGFSSFNQAKYQGKSREATLLGDRVTLKGVKGSESYQAWQVIAKDGYEIERGNSGGPLLCQESGKVIGVISNHKGVHEGYAIAIEHLRDIWPDTPPFLFESDDESASPFIGLSAFSIEESHLFFGRDREIGEIIARLKQENLIAVVGDSGSGKSSVIKAGVIPEYLNGVLDRESEMPFHLIDTRPAQNAFNELANSILHISKEYQLDFDSTNQLKKAIKSKHQEDILNALEYVFKEKNANLLMYVDQFEELFTLCDETVQQEFIALLLYLLQNQTENLRIKIILTIRRDYYNLLSEHEAFFELTQRNKYTLRRMNNEQLRECIERPLDKTFIDKDKVEAFAKAVLSDMGDESSELALLQIALTQTWKHKKDYENNLLRTYHEIGEVSGALAKLADDTWKSLKPIEQKILEYIFIRIIKSSDTGGVIRRLAERDEFSEDRWQLAQKLASALDSQGNVASEKNARLGRLLTIKGEEGRVVELTHEALVRQWPMYQKWLKKVSKHNLKRIHDAVIEKSKIYTRTPESKFLLMGYDLEEGLRLLGDEYIAYLSPDEIEYLRKSKRQKLFNRLYKVGITLGMVALIGYIVFLVENRVSMTFEQLEQRIENNELSMQRRDTIYGELIIPDQRGADNQALEKLIKLTPSIEYGAEKEYWLQRLKVMQSDNLDKLFESLRFEAYVNQGNAKFRKAEYAKALEAYLEADRLKPHTEYVKQYIGNMYLYLQKPNDALVFFHKMLEINPQSETAYMLLGSTHGNMGNHALALSALQKVIMINPNNFLAHQYLGLNYWFLKDYPNSIKHFEQSLALNPSFEPVYINIITYYRTFLDHEKVTEYTKRLLKLNAGNPYHYLNLFEFQLVNNVPFDAMLEEEFITAYRTQSLTYMKYEMLRLLQAIATGKEVDVTAWHNRYRGMSLVWGFALEDQWLKTFEATQPEVYKKLQSALDTFKRQQFQN